MECPDYEIDVFEKGVSRQASESDGRCVEDTINRERANKKGRANSQRGVKVRKEEYDTSDTGRRIQSKQNEVTYAIRFSPSTDNVLCTALGFSSASTSITCFAINACSGFAKGTLIVLFIVIIVSQGSGPQVQSTRAFDDKSFGVDNGEG